MGQIINATVNVETENSTLSVTATQAAGGQLLTFSAPVLDVTLKLADGQPPIAYKIGNGEWERLEGRDGVTLSGAESVRVAKGAAQGRASSLMLAARMMPTDVTVDGRSLGVVTAETNAVTGRLEIPLPENFALMPELTPSGVDDAPAMLAMAQAWNGLIKLSAGRFRIESYLELHLEAFNADGLVFMGAGDGVTTIEVPDTYQSTRGTDFANWLDAKPAIRVFTTSNSLKPITIGNFTINRVSSTGDVSETSSGLAFCFDVPPTFPFTGYAPFEPLRLRNIKAEGWDVVAACNDVTNLDAKGLVCTVNNYTFATGFNCDIWEFDQCKFGTGLSAARISSGNRPNTPFFVNGYYGRGKEVLNYTITSGVGTVATGAPVMVTNVDVYLDATSGPLTDGVRRILTVGSGTFTFDATGIADGSGQIKMGEHSAWGAGNQWQLTGCWFMGIDRIFRSPGSTLAFPINSVRFLSSYWEQAWILLESENNADLEFDNCYFVGHTLSIAQTYRSSYDNTKQAWPVFAFQNSGTSPSSRVKFRKCFGATYTDGWVGNIGADALENRAFFVEFDDSKFTFSEASRQAKWYHITCLSNISGQQGAVYLETQYQAAVNSGLSAEMRGIGFHRYRGLIRLASSDPVVYQASSNAASMVPTIPATLIPVPPQANIYRLEGIDKAVTIDAPKVRRYTTDATFDDYTSSHLVVNGTTRGRIASLQMPTLRFVLQQDATAGRAITWNSIYKFHTAFTQAVTTTDANKTTIVEFEWDGVNWVQSSRANSWI